MGETTIPVEEIMVPFHRLRFLYLSPKGMPLATEAVINGEREALLRGHNFLVEGPGVDPNRVLRVELPCLHYQSPEMPAAKVVMFDKDYFEGHQRRLAQMPVRPT